MLAGNASPFVAASFTRRLTVFEHTVPDNEPKRSSVILQDFSKEAVRGSQEDPSRVDGTETAQSVRSAPQLPKVHSKENRSIVFSCQPI